MENKKNPKLLEEQLRKFKYRVDYKVNESPKYRPLVNDGEEFDDVPLTNEAGDQEDAPKPEGQVPPEPSNDQNATPAETPIPAFDDPNADPNAQADPNAAPANDPTAVPAGTPVEPNPEAEVDNIQNDIIKHNIEAMKSIHDQLESLNASIEALNVKSDILAADVEEVREPTNSEKLMNKTKVSYPYYFNLNDLWSGNWFDEKRKEEKERGIKELPDGSFVADFDDLPQKSKTDIQNSFNEI